MAEDNNLQDYIDEKQLSLNYQNKDNDAMICYYQKLKRVITHISMLKLPNKTKLMISGSSVENAKKDLFKMKLFHIEAKVTY